MNEKYLALRSETKKRVVDSIVKKDYHDAMRAINDLAEGLERKSKDTAKSLKNLLEIAEEMAIEKRKKKLTIKNVLNKIKSPKKSK